MIPFVGLDILEWRKISCLWRCSNPDPSVAQAAIPCDTYRSSDITNRPFSVTAVCYVGRQFFEVDPNVVRPVTPSVTSPHDT